MYHLSDDYSRCLDKLCPKREDCLRWLCRDVCDRWVLMQYSLRRPGTDACSYQIRPSKPTPLLGPCDSYQEESARRRAEYWKAEQIAANRKIDAMMPVIAAARCIRHWHDSVDGGMVVSGEHVRALWEALADYDELEGSDGR